MIVKVLYFAQVADEVGTSKEEISLELSTPKLRDLMDYLVKCYPVLDELSFQIALNQSITKENKPLKENDEIALLPPYAGG